MMMHKKNLAEVSRTLVFILFSKIQNSKIQIFNQLEDLEDIKK